MLSSAVARHCGFGIISALLCSIAWRAVISRLSSTAPPPITLPIAAAWVYLSDDQNYTEIPSQWLQINFTVADVLLVGPVGLQEDGTFGLYSSQQTGPLANRFNWVIQQARSMNPDIKIIASQWWGSSPNIWGYDISALQNETAIQKYAASVATFLQTWSSVSGGIDGYDIDYECYNVQDYAPALLTLVRQSLDALGKAEGGRKFYLTVSPASSSYLDETTQVVDFVNMQTYAGGSGITPQTLVSLGFKSDQLLYGICPETNCGGQTIDQVEQQYTANNMAGIHVWRLNSDNLVDEGKTAAQVYEFLHP
ncbi:glycoside hydrolase superfamily [Lasiosphaeria ovina]|uniref:Glycoside hydrolase superfamily n=1 Tax=Lasiosphaeria ovina TaxID=92902 RepID=A0AAE0KHR4_9PEZI|nr:glycoside hydrolase superfamily [Lasiosphaeria ovina]